MSSYPISRASHPKTTNPPLAFSNNGCLVLSYHRVLPKNWLINIWSHWIEFYTDSSELTKFSVSGSDFRYQIDYLQRQGVRFITPTELEAFIKGKAKMPPKCALITFDDVDISVYRDAFPVLQRKNIPFALFVITGNVGNQNFHGLKFCTWPEIKEMADSNLATVGVHTNNLHYLDSKTQKPPFLAPGSARCFAVDMRLSKQAMRKKIGITPCYFAYPYGFGTPETDKVALGSGMHLIFTLSSGVVKPGDPAFFVKRTLVNKNTWPAIAAWAARK